MSTIGATLLIHPRSVDDLERDYDSRRREVILSKIGAYSLLEEPPSPEGDDVFLELVGRPSNPNDEVDNAILYAVYRDAVRYLVTEDRRIRKKAERVSLRDRTLSIDEALQVLGGPTNDQNFAHPPALTETSLYNLRLNDPFFDSLKDDYPEFEEWFKDVSQAGRKGWVYHEDNGLVGALLVYKTEEEPIPSSPPLPKRKRLKISTFKVDHRGYKIGELFIRLGVRAAIKRNCQEIYMTHFSKANDGLIDLISEYGFKSVAKTGRGEDVFLKNLYPDKDVARRLAPTIISQKFYPAFYDGGGVRKFLVPIRPEYHEKLFIDSKSRQTKLPEYHGQFIIEGNAIRKAYLCNSINQDVSRGDIMLFYRSVDRQQVTSLGVVESVHRRVQSLKQVARLVEKRTVYSIDEIRAMLRNPTMIFLFNWHFHFQHPVTSSDLRTLNIFVPQTITRLPHEQYVALKNRGGIDERFVVN